MRIFSHKQKNENEQFSIGQKQRGQNDKKVTFATKNEGEFWSVLVIFMICRLLSTGSHEESETHSSHGKDCGVTCRRNVKSQCSPKISRNATRRSQPPVRLRSGGRGVVGCTGGAGGREMVRTGTRESRSETENVLMDVDDFEHEVTVASD